jgi:hypothetical protein
MRPNTTPAAGRSISLLGAAVLILVAVGGAVAVGGVLKGQSAAVPPVDAPSATATVSATPSAAPPSATPTVAASSLGPNVSPSASPRSSGAIDVALVTTAGPAATATVIDRSGSLLGAASGQPGEGGSVPFGTITAIERFSEDPFIIQITWTDMPCATTYTVTINQDLSTLVIRRADCEGDAIALDRVLQLTFDHKFDTTGLTPSFVVK